MFTAIKNSDHFTYFWIFSLLVLGSIFGAIYLEFSPLLVLPFLLLGIGIAVINYKIFYYLLFFTIPLSVEFYFGSIGTDLPTEPLMIIVSAIILLYLLYKPEKISGLFFIHPIALIIYASLGWMMITSLSAYDPIISFKFILAKSWYLLAFFVGPFFFLKNIQDVRKLIKLVAITLFITVCVVLIRHSLTGFDFAEVNNLLGPAYRNHVNYAAIIVVFLPFVGFLSSKENHKRWRYPIIILIFVIAIYFAYTRAVYLALIGMVGMYGIVRYKLTKIAVIGGLIAPVLLLLYLLPNNKYLDYSPDFHRTIAHYDFDDLMAATAKGEDASSMERVYRWVAAYKMVQERPLLGYGPGNFYSAYKPYTLFSFITYVSNNPEKSGIHSYYLMTLVEQGFIGLILFVLLMAIFFIRAEEVYHRIKDPQLKSLMMACILSFTTLAILHTLNDLVEVDKTGAFFYLSLSLLVMLDCKLIRDNEVI